MINNPTIQLVTIFQLVTKKIQKFKDFLFMDEPSRAGPLYERHNHFKGSKQFIQLR